MTERSQQGPGRAENYSAGLVGGPRLLRLVLFVMWGASSLGTGCDCAPARSKYWRHLPEPEAEPAQPSIAGDHAAPGAGEPAGPQPEAPRDRATTLRIHMDVLPRHLNPLVVPSVGTLRVSQDTIFETLIRYRPPAGGAGAGPGRYEPGLATGWRVSPGGKEIRIDLRAGVKFHDGRPLTALDVQFTLDTIWDRRIQVPHVRAALRDVAAIEYINPRAVRIKLSRVNGYVLRALAEIPILPEHIYKKRLRPARGPLVGTGPYRLTARTRRMIRLERVKSYWGAKPAIATIEFVASQDAAAALTAAKRGEIDFIPALIPAHYPEQTSAPGIAARFEPIRLRPSTFQYVVMDAAKPPFNDPRVRHAVALLIDRAGISKEVFGGLATPIAGPIWPGGPGDGPGPAPPSYDPAAAGKLLDRAGWRDSDGDGKRERAGKRLRVALLATKSKDLVRKRIVTSLRRSGFVVELRRGPPAVLLKRLRNNKFDMALAEWRGWADHDLSRLLRTGGRLNFGRFSDSGVDAALETLRSAWDPVSRASRMGALATAIMKSWPIAPITAPSPVGLLHKRVRGAVVWNGWISLRALSLASDGPSE